MSASDQVYLPHPRAAFRTIDGDVVIVHTLENTLVKLNETGSAIWQRLDGRTVEQIAAELEELFEVGAAEARADTDAFLAMLLERGFVERSPAPEPGGDGG